MHPKQYPGWNVNSLTGLFTVLLGSFTLLGALSLHFPHWLTTPELQAAFPRPWFRALVQLSGILAIGLGWLNIARHDQKLPGLFGFGCTLLAFSLGEPALGAQGKGLFFGIDWFLLDLLVTAIVFVPLERVFALHPSQPIIRKGSRTDLAHFFVSHVSVQAVTFVTVLPGAFLLHGTGALGFRSIIAAQPAALQFLEILVVADLMEYWLHRAFHRFPALWRVHAVHHSSLALDWLAASRIHIVEALGMRAFTYLALYGLGFSTQALFAYLAFVSFHAIFLHANVHWKLRWLDGWFVTPRFHHWHHADDPRAYDKNFALHFPLWDRLFGTYYLPSGQWPAAYGIHGFPPLRNYFAHLAYPFRRARNKVKPVPDSA